MKYFIPTYEQALEMVDTRGSLIFYESKYNVDGYYISCFNYRLTGYNDFIKPIENKEYDANEIRGITYVFDKDGTYKTYLMLRKFWNLNQVTETQLPLLINKKIKYVHNKEDGSLVSFIKIPNGRIVSKTKMSFSNEQTTEVDIIVSENKNISNFIEKCLEMNYSTMWEYTSYKNKIVLDYHDTNLILLRVRNNITGEYIDIEQFNNLGFDIAKIIYFNNLTDIIDWVKVAENVEGVVVTFDDNYMIKIKTEWYFARHKLLTENLNREDAIIEMILNETLDDIKSQLDQQCDSERILWIENIEEVVRNYMIERVSEVDVLVSDYNGDMKEFSKKYYNTPNFSLASLVIHGKMNSYDAVKSHTLKYTYRLEQAKTFIKTGKLC